MAGSAARPASAQRDGRIAGHILLFACDAAAGSDRWGGALHDGREDDQILPALERQVGIPLGPDDGERAAQPVVVVHVVVDAYGRLMLEELAGATSRPTIRPAALEALLRHDWPGNLGCSQ